MSPPSELDLPPEIVTVLPADPYEQLEIARKITSMAITSRVGDLESSTKHLTRQVEEKDFTISHLERRVSELQLALEQSSARLSGALENQVHNQRKREIAENLSSPFSSLATHDSLVSPVLVLLVSPLSHHGSFWHGKEMKTSLGIICFSLGLG